MTKYLKKHSLVNEKLKAFTAICMVFLLTSCGSHFKIIKPNLNDFFSTKKVVNSGSILTYVPLKDINTYSFTMLDSYSTFEENFYNPKAINYRKYFSEMLQNSGFINVMTREEVAIEKGTNKDIFNLNDAIGLKHLSDKVGPFLNVSLEHLKVMDTQIFNIKVFDPAQGRTLLKVNHQAVNWKGTDQDILYPGFNVLKRWMDESKKL